MQHRLFNSELPIHTPENTLVPMDVPRLLVSLTFFGSLAFGQSTTPPAFDVASVRPSQHQVGPDYNNQLTWSSAGLTARNVTLQRLCAEAYHLQLRQVAGPRWIDQDEYDIEANVGGPATREQMAVMLQRLVAARFNVKQHTESREMRVYELVVDKAGPKIHPVDSGGTPTPAAGFHFHGNLRQFADLLAVQLSIPASDNPAEPVRASTSPIPVIDKTGLGGIFDFSVDIHPELGTDMFAQWQRTLQDQLGLRIESRKGNVPVMVIDDAAKTPTEN
ncbi:MAG: TIGR03435 family protein [Terracidiphilus sp.]|jgi:uncharacterized protein (TIGR03435 family)